MPKIPEMSKIPEPLEMSKFKELLKIDLYHLHIECRDFPNVFFEYASKFAEASAKKFRVEEQLKLLKSETRLEIDQARASMDLEVRGNIEDFQKQFKIKKFTEAGINSLIITNPDFIDLQKKINKRVQNKIMEVTEAINELETYKAAMFALAHKKSSLEDAVRLQLGNFYSEPKIDSKNIEKEAPKKPKHKSTLKERQGKARKIMGK